MDCFEKCILCVLAGFLIAFILFVLVIHSESYICDKEVSTCYKTIGSSDQSWFYRNVDGIQELWKDDESDLLKLFWIRD